ncbi:UNKNOWN [Stylonychia lemnae]|uniref:Uncharacterized protein n=1 Tax=Stylonychia lemnae TaxID=5949 RepID=A0A078B313_STYLE|nr:UNKNOWN [Stylonychia lemnae]|eukprot:CDW88895.1 UNKNOWN [Stylonychia lemnae]
MSMIKNQATTHEFCDCTIGKWEPLENLHLELNDISLNFKNLPHVTSNFIRDGYLYLLVKDLFNHQKSVPIFSEFMHILFHMESFQFQDQLNGDFLMRFNPGYVNIPVALKIQGNQISVAEFQAAIFSSPFFKRCEILSFNPLNLQLQIQFRSKFSSQAFTHWLNKYYSDVLSVVCNSSDLVLQIDAEPYNPKNEINLESEKKRIVEKMYQYYNYLLLDQNKDRIRKENNNNTTMNASTNVTANNLTLKNQTSNLNSTRDLMLKQSKSETSYLLDKTHRDTNDAKAQGSLLLKTDTIDDEVTTALGFVQKNPFKQCDEGEQSLKHPDISIRYSMHELLMIFKVTGRFDHPLTSMSSFKMDENDKDAKKILCEITNKKPNVILNLLNFDQDEKPQNGPNGLYSQRSTKNHASNILLDIDTEIHSLSTIKI